MSSPIRSQERTPPSNLDDQMRALLARSLDAQQRLRVQLAPAVQSSLSSAPPPAPSLPAQPAIAPSLYHQIRALLAQSVIAQQRLREQLAPVVAAANAVPAPSAPIPIAESPAPIVAPEAPPLIGEGSFPQVGQQRSTSRALQSTFGLRSEESYVRAIESAHATHPAAEGVERVAVDRLRNYLPCFVYNEDFQRRITAVLDAMPADGISQQAFATISENIKNLLLVRKIRFLSGVFPHHRVLNRDGNSLYTGFVMIYLDHMIQDPALFANRIQQFSHDGIEIECKERVLNAMRTLQASPNEEQLGLIRENSELVLDFVRYFRSKSSHHAIEIARGQNGGVAPQNLLDRWRRIESMGNPDQPEEEYTHAEVANLCDAFNQFPLKIILLNREIEVLGGRLNYSFPQIHFHNPGRHPRYALVRTPQNSYQLIYREAD